MSNILKKCEFDKDRLEAMISKRQTQKKPHTHHASHFHNHAHTQAQSHAHLAQKHHAYLYAKLYTCTYYSRKGHLIMFLL